MKKPLENITFTSTQTSHKFGVSAMVLLRPFALCSTSSTESSTSPKYVQEPLHPLENAATAARRLGTSPSATRWQNTPSLVLPESSRWLARGGPVSSEELPTRCLTMPKPLSGFDPLPLDSNPRTRLLSREKREVLAGQPCLQPALSRCPAIAASAGISHQPPFVLATLNKLKLTKNSPGSL